MVATVVLDGPVLSLLYNRIRALQIELEDPISHDKPLIWAALNELQNLCQPLFAVLAQQLEQHSLNEVLFRNYSSPQMQVEGNSTSKPHDVENTVPNSGCASILAATDAATPTMRRIERAAIDAATPITYPPRDFLFLIHEHLLASGLLQTASMLLKEAQLEPSPSLVVPSSRVKQPFRQEAPPEQLQLSSGQVPLFLSNILKLNENKDFESQYETPITFPVKNKLSDLTNIGVLSSTEKQLIAGDLRFHSPIFSTPGVMHKSSLWTDATGLSRLSSILRNQQKHCTSVCVDETQSSKSNLGQVTPWSLLIIDDPHVCLKPKQSLNAPYNVTSRLATRELKSMDDRVHGKCRDRQFVYSRFKSSHSTSSRYMLTCLTFLGDSCVAAGNDKGYIDLFDFDDGLQTQAGHQYPLTHIESFNSGERQLLLSSSSNDVKLWEASHLFGDNIFYLLDIHLFDGCKAARVSNSGNVFAALSLESRKCEILLYDIQTCQLASRFSDTSTTLIGRDDLYSLIHFNCSDSMLLWNGVLWDRRVSDPVHRFDQLTDFGGGGFHPAGNEVIINSEVLDLRKLSLLHSVPSLHQTTITFSPGGDVIYAILRRDYEDILSAFDTFRLDHPLFAAFRTVDAVSYTDIATIPVDNCVLDFKTEPTDSIVGLLIMSDKGSEVEDKYEHEFDIHGCVKIYEIGE